MEENSQEKSAKKPIYKKWWFWVIIVVIALAIIFASVGGTSSGNNNSGASDAHTNTDNNGTSDADSNTDNSGTSGADSNADNSGTSGANQTTYGLNQTVSVGNLEYTVTGVNDTKSVGSSYVGETTENNFVIVTISIKNNGTSERNLSDSNFIYYRGKSKYESSSSGIYLDNGFYVLVTIGAGITKTINVLYEIPSEHETTDYILVKDSFKSEKIYLK